MKPKRPTSIKVGWATLNIVWVPEADWPKEDHGRCGVTRVAQGEIRLLEYDGGQEAWYREVLIHEALHAAHVVSGLGQYPSPEKTSADEREEWVTTLLAGPMLSLIRDNPEAMAWLTA